MVLLRLILKILAMPLIAAVTLIQWAGIFLTQFSSVIFNLLAGLMFLLSVIGWLMGICTGAETIRMLAVGFVVFIIPHIAEWLIVRIAVINCNLRNFLKSLTRQFHTVHKATGISIAKCLPLLFYPEQGGKTYDHEHE